MEYNSDNLQNIHDSWGNETLSNLEKKFKEQINCCHYIGEIKQINLTNLKQIGSKLGKDIESNGKTLYRFLLTPKLSGFKRSKYYKSLE